jgi:hypothetical protein
MDIIFDLDGTVVCSKHRYRKLESGGIDLPYWIKSNTRENCFKDGLLPAIRTMRRDYNDGHNVIVCTARVLSDWDFEFFDVMNVPYHVMLSRPIDNTQNDADLKEFQLRRYASENGLSWAKFCKTAMFFEDAKIVLERMDKIGIPTINAVEWNWMLSRSA